MRWLRLLMVVLLAMLAWLQYHLWLDEGGRRSVAKLEAQVEQQARDNGGLQERNDALQAEVEDLKSGEAAVEERARSELGMIKPGETFYRVVEPASPMAAPAVDPVAGEAGAD
ncbi:cell division protein FtsB [Novilysobacter selenitireducens]|uniref:Cell division protein FtsB n=1 Tax=Novilysobacter selenitireducens TaxID=2872639 RepID=A0ABS7T925_9GAMM|nr:cell division protein FtsB [Lysobacter selenitireducens]MBZ4040377.1 cell division protein FtsB [Lysobacter selenitireducens]